MAFPILSKFEKGECEQCEKPATHVITKLFQPAWLHIVCKEHMELASDSMVVREYELGFIPEQYYR